MLEHYAQPLLSRAAYVSRIVRHALVALAVVAAALGIGILGYHIIEGLPWVDATLNAAMILGGMGPVNAIQTTTGKLFASAYALFSGLVFVAVAGILFAPAYHRFLHRFHLESDRSDGSDRSDRSNKG